MKKSLALVLPFALLLTSCSQPAAGQEIAVAACKSWKTAWSNALSVNIGDARSQYYDFDAAYELAKSATELNKDWELISDAIGDYWLFAASQFSDSLLPDSANQVKAMDACKEIGVEVNA